MDAEEFKRRTKAFALRVVRLVDALPSSGAAWVMGRQLLRCGTSVGANYRAACRARSRSEFVAKMGIVEEECDETLYWMELLIDSGLVKADLLESLMSEAKEILSLVVASIKTARARKQPASRGRKAYGTESGRDAANPQSEIRNPQCGRGPRADPPLAGQSAIRNPQSAIEVGSRHVASR